MAPSTPNPMPGGPSMPWTQRFSAPAAHGLHCPQPSRPYTATGSPCSSAFDAAAQPVDPAGGFVPEHERRAPRRHALGEFAHHVQVRVARAGAADLDDDLSGTRLGLGQVHQFGIGLEALELQGAHESSGAVRRAALAGS